MIERFTRMAPMQQYAPLLSQRFMSEAQRCFYDTAQVLNHSTLSRAHQVIPDTHFVFGSDFPYRCSAGQVLAVEDCGIYTDAQLGPIARVNFAALLRKYASAP